ncbi:MAG: hypothetical protein IRZ03_19070, partial [Acidobacterium ailaaui]|nr:hypothetical protein [Pseudacidobacterium ailaaui]
MEENILVRIGADLSQLTRGIKKATRDVNKFAKETMTISQALNSFDKTAQTSFKNIDLKNVNAEFREASKEITAMKNVLRLAELKGVMPFKKQMLDTQKKMYGLSGAMGNLNATNREFMSTVKQLGAEYKKAHDGMIKANKMLGVSMIQTAGRMMNMTTQAKRISENYARMANPMYKVNAAGLAIANTMNKIANNGNAAVLSLKMLGPNANMKQLVDMQRMINQGLMRFQAVALAASITGVIFYGSLHKAAMKANKEYAKAFKDMTANLKKAFEPMVQVFAQVMIPVFNFINALAKMTIAFNKAHPTMAKILQGILLLIPALTLLLSPLAIGIGLINGMAAAFGSLWMIIGPLITGMAAMSGTVLLVAAAVVGLTAGITALWKKNEGFRNAVISAWDKIKAKAQEVFGFIPSLIDTAAQKLSTLKDAIVAAFSGDFSQLTAIFSQILPSIIAMLVGGIPGLIITAARFLPAIAQGIQQTLPTLLQTISQIIISAVSFIAQYLPMFVQTGVTVLTNLIAGLTQALPLIVSAALTVITTLITTIANALPNVISAGVTILTSLLSGITQMLPSLVNTALQIIITIVNAVVSNLPKIIDAGIKILNALINGIVSILPKLIAAGVTLIVSLVVALVNNLPK